MEVHATILASHWLRSIIDIPLFISFRWRNISAKPGCGGVSPSCEIEF